MIIVPVTPAPLSAADIVGEHRPLLFSIAYRMLGSAASAEDILQEAYLRYERALRAAEAGHAAPIESPKAYLTAVVTRLAIDELKSARSRRESYVGVWLPEPLVTDESTERPADPQAHVEAAESLSMAFLLVLDRLNPLERAVFLLHDVFGYAFAEVAQIVKRSEVNCRQIASRARKRVREGRPQLDMDRGTRDETATRFFAALAAGDMDALVRLLARDVVVYGDGGGKAPQWSQPIAGLERVARLLMGIGRLATDHALVTDRQEINGQPGAIIRTPDGSIVSVYSLEISDGLVQAFRSVVNPDKLRHLGPVADLRALAARRPSRNDDQSRKSRRLGGCAPRSSSAT